MVLMGFGALIEYIKWLIPFS